MNSSIDKNISESSIFQRILEEIPIRIFWKDRDSRFIGCNNLFLRDAGLSHLDQLVGKTDYDMVWKDRADLYRQDDLEIIGSCISKLGYEEPQTTPEGKTIWRRTSKVPLRDATNQVVGILGIYEDITEKKRMEMILEKRTSQLKEAQRIAQIGSWELDLVNGELDWSDEIYHMFGLPNTYPGLSYETFLNTVHPEDREMVNRAYMESVEKHLAYEVTHRLQMPKGGIKYVLEKGHTDYAPDGTAQRSIGTVQDVTERKLVENTLRLHSEILLHVREGVQMTRAEDETIVYSTPAFDHMYGYATSELIGKHARILYPPINTTNTIADIIRDALCQTGSWSGEVHHVKKDGTALFCWMNISAYEHQEFGPVWISVHEDITQRKSVEEELRFAKEIANRELIVREVHHRIKNNLQGITGVLRQFADQHPEVATPINQAISQVQSIAVIHGLQGRASLAQVRLCELACAVASGLETLWQKPITMDIPSEWIPCVISETEAVPLALVINELISNAIKHSKSARPVCIALRHEPRLDTIRLTIRNTGLLPPDFSYENAKKTSSGLSLVAALLPHTGALLYWDQQGGNVVTSLELAPPTIILESGFLYQL